MTDYITWVRDLTDALTDLEIATGQTMRPPCFCHQKHCVEPTSTLAFKLPGLAREGVRDSGKFRQRGRGSHQSLN